MSNVVLDHGYVQFIESWGRGLDGQMEAAIIEAARMSTGRGFLGWDLKCEKCDGSGARLASHRADGDAPCLNCKGRGLAGDEKLLAFLWTHRHTTPFEMAGMTIEVQAPIFVFREWHRHRTQSYNEMSARYTPLPDVNYTPSIERLLMSGGANKQATSTGAKLDALEATRFLTELRAAYEHVQHVYENGLARGVPKELARLPVPVGRYSRMRASANLLNWLRFLGLRMDENAQWEIRQYANAVFSIVKEQFPRTAQLFQENKL